VSGAALGLASLALVAVAGASWWRRMQQVRLPRNAAAYVLACGAAVALGVAALAAGAGLAGGLAAGLAILLGGAFLVLLAASGQRRGTLRVAVGRPVPAFEALDDEGRPFAVASLRGRPFLLKFFRGHWCPYCVAELRRWRELAPELEAHGVTVVAVCAEAADEIRKGRVKHGLAATMLPDPALAITDLYGLRNPKNFAPRPGVVVPLPIPTTILVDASGVVRWIDQSADYMRRSDPEVVRAALGAALGAPGERASGTYGT
jgi:peroxiredoxin